MSSVKLSSYAGDQGGLTAALAAAGPRGTVYQDIDLHLDDFYAVKSPVDLIAQNGSVIRGAGLRYQAPVRTHGLVSLDANGRGFTWAKGSDGSRAFFGMADRSATYGTVIEPEVDDVWLVGVAAAHTGKHGHWTRGATRPRHIQCTAFETGHQGFEWFGSKGFRAIGNESWGNASLGFHFLRAIVGEVGGNESHDNANNGFDCHSSEHLTIHHNKSHHNGSAGAEGTGILIFEANDIVVANNECYNNAQGQPGNRSGIAVAGTAKRGTHDVLIIGNECYDDQTSHTQEFGVNIGGDKGYTDHIYVVHNFGHGNVKAGVGTKGVAAGRDIVVEPNWLRAVA